MHPFWRLLVAILAATVLWLGLGFLATMPLGLLFGWSGHPAIPAAPAWVYLALYAGLLPLFCMFVGWKAAQLLSRRLSKR